AAQRRTLSPVFAGVEPHAFALFALAAGMLFVSFAFGPLTRLAGHSNLLSAPATSSGALATWMRDHSPTQALFLTPPDDDSLRFRSERAIVVDWKGTPAVPTEVLAWYERLSAVIGRRLASEADLAGYDTLDPARVEALRQRYGFDYVVLKRGHAAAFSDYDPV